MKAIVTSVAALLLLAGVSGAKPLDLMLGARAHGMGGAFTGVANDINAAYWNPAGMAGLKTMEFGASNQINQDVSGLNTNLISGIIPIKDAGAVGFTWQMTNAGLEQGDPDGPGGVYEDHWRENAFSAVFARRLWDKLAFTGNTFLGCGLNRYTYSSDEHHGAGLGFDIGLLMLLPYDMRVGITARSLAADIEGEMYSPEYRLGLGYIRTFAGKHTLTAGSDILLKRDIEYADAAALDPVAYNFKLFEGVEYAVKVADFSVMTRGGCNFAVMQDREKFALNVTAGLGVRYLAYGLDYAFKYNTDPDMSLGIAHHVGLVLMK